MHDWPFLTCAKAQNVLEVLDEQDLSKAHASVSIANYMFIGTKQSSLQSVNIV